MTNRKQTQPQAKLQPMSVADRDALILEIAQRQFQLTTLDTQNSDGLDFHDVAVWAIRNALIEAFDAGRASAAQV